MGDPKAHAILSASGSKRWLSCTPSAKLEQGFPEESSEYAAEGTFAHSLAELKLGKALMNIKPSAFKKRLAEMQLNSLYSQGMEEYIDQYVALVGERFMAAKKICKDTLVLLEQRLDFSNWVPEGFGTGDVVIISDDTIEIIDLKYGKGVPVSAEDNSQMRLYGLGCINTYEMLYDFSKVRMTIIQPRLDSVSTEEMTVQELLAWGEEIKPKAEMAIAGEGDFVPGEHCRFCRARATCKARADENLELAKYDFQDAFLLSDEEIVDILAKVDALQKWAEDIKAYAFEQAEKHGKKWPGWKLVEGRSTRKYTDEEAVAAKLKEEGIAECVIFEKKLLGITAMEKAIGKTVFGEYLDGLIVKPAGKPVLVPESDKRPELSSAASAASDFGEAVE